MEDALQQFEDEWFTGSRGRARSMAADYVNAHHAELGEMFGTLSIDEMVAVVTAARARGDVETRIKADMWLLTEHPPQHIAASGGN